MVDGNIWNEQNVCNFLQIYLMNLKAIYVICTNRNTLYRVILFASVKIKNRVMTIYLLRTIKY